MSRVSLSDTSDYQLVNDSQDVRGYQVVDQDGQPVGVVDRMIVDTDAELVTSLVLLDGTEVPASDVTIGESVVYYDRRGADALAASGSTGAVREGVTVFDDGGRVVRREHVANVNEAFDADFDEDFRSHHETTYGASGRSYDDTSSAYRYGYTAAHDEAHRNRSYADAEADLRSGYTAGRSFDADREAVQHGFGRAQRRPR
ncbi:MAG TPA: PRC-barrel domain-containing protein [Rubricoccaceae bacterium]|jgi:hypothetical protein